MFAKVSNASKFGFILLVKYLEAKGYQLIDCQQETSHLRSLGGNNISRSDFLEMVNDNKKEITRPGNWKEEPEDLFKYLKN